MGIPSIGFGGATMIGALLVGKVVLIADKQHFMNKSPDKPPLYNNAWKSGIYFMATFLVLHRTYLLMSARVLGIMEANRRLLAEVVWPHFWITLMWLTV